MPEEKKPRTRAKRRDYRAELENIRVYCETMAIAFKKIAGNVESTDLVGQRRSSAADAYVDIAERIKG